MASAHYTPTRKPRSKVAQIVPDRHVPDRMTMQSALAALDYALGAIIFDWSARLTARRQLLQPVRAYSVAQTITEIVIGNQLPDGRFITHIRVLSASVFTGVLEYALVQGTDDLGQVSDAQHPMTLTVNIRTGAWTLDDPSSTGWNASSLK